MSRLLVVTLLLVLPIVSAACAPDALTEADAGSATATDAGTTLTDAGTHLADAGTDLAEPPPTIFVHGVGGHASDFDDMRDGLLALGFDQTFAIDLGDTNRSTLEQADDLAAFVDDVKAETGAAEVNLVGHSLGAIVARIYVALDGGEANVARVISILGPQHGNNLACFTTFLGDSSRELCPEYASDDASLQFALNGDPNGDDVDETPFGVEDSGGHIVWTAVSFTHDLVIPRHESECLDQREPDDCSAAVNVVVDWDGVDHGSLIRDDRAVALVASLIAQ